MITTLNILKKMLQNFSLSHHVFFPTHDAGHILDLITTNVSSKFNIHSFCIDTCISDHKEFVLILTLLSYILRKKLFLIIVSRISISLTLIKIFLLSFPILDSIT